MNLKLLKNADQLKEDFTNLKTREDIAKLLEVAVKKLIFHLYVLSPQNKYSSFSISKKGGGTRVITAPISPIKILQRKLKQVFESFYQPKSNTHGFVSRRSIISNARMHQKRRYVLNIDLEDFFPSIHFGRVRGLFMGIPYNLNQEVSTILAQICCYDKKLPQGAPTSPIISNMICARLDSNLKKLAYDNQCVYSRYADDITFSTNRSKFPSSIAYLSDNGKIEIGNEILQIINENWFKVNLNKTRLQLRHQRQEVTGLTVNRYPNINRKYLKQVRAILHAWKKFGADSTSDNYFGKYASSKYSNVQFNSELFQKIILGKIEFIGMVKGKSSRTYFDLQNKFYSLAPSLKTVKKRIHSGTRPMVYTEGKTDIKHLQAALNSFKSNGFYVDLFYDSPTEETFQGNSVLLRRMEFEQERSIKNDRPHIFIFDRDDKKVLDSLNQNEDYCERKNEVYSIVLPIPSHRENIPEICIEFYYSDRDLRIKDENGRRLFLNTEFDLNSGKHIEEDLHCEKIFKIRGFSKIIDDGVFDSTRKNIALTKNNFAENVLNKKKNFENIDFSGFETIFGIIATIINIFDSKKR